MRTLKVDFKNKEVVVIGLWDFEELGNELRIVLEGKDDWKVRGFEQETKIEWNYPTPLPDAAPIQPYYYTTAPNTISHLTGNETTTNGTVTLNKLNNESKN